MEIDKLRDASTFTVGTKTRNVGFKAKRLKIFKTILSAACILFILLIILAGAVTNKRNSIWKAEITLWEDVVSKSPNKARGHNNIGMAYYDRNLTNKAIEEFKKTTALQPDYADAYNNLGSIYYLRRKIDEAIAEYQKAVRFDPFHIEAHYNLGIAYKSKGLTKEAITEFEEALKIQPDNEKARNILSLLSE